HEKLFQIEVLVDGRALGVGVGPSRRVAETAAAPRAIELLRSEAGDRTPRGMDARDGAAHTATGAAKGTSAGESVAAEPSPPAGEPAR
ncbi:MAG: Double-stranded binding motif, partial [Chloroflexota bacterium]|nr:Double-stranded binding motif [Chloroflexota bacterium]